MTEELLDEEDARRIALDFMRGVYYRGKITLDQTRLVTGGESPVYAFSGTIKMQSRSTLGRLISQNTPYNFVIQVHAVEGSVVNYEVK